MICIGALKKTEHPSEAEVIIDRYAQNPRYGISLSGDGDIEKIIPIKTEDYWLVFRVFSRTSGGEHGIFEQDETEAVLYLSRLFTELMPRNYECELFICDENSAIESIPTVSVLPYELAGHLFDCNREGKCCHFVFKEDWRLNDQMDYLDGEKLERNTFKATETNDHDHCCFCWKTFSEFPEDTHIGYCTDDRYCWVCEECYDDYKFIFGWEKTAQTL